MPDKKAILSALKKFADTVTAKMTTLTAGEPEDQLRGPFEVFMQEVGQALALKVVSTGETRLPGRMGKPDYAVHAADLLAGYVELKAPGVGANPNRFTGHNKEQWKRFKSIPNLIYCDGNDWGLYQSGEAVRPVVRLSGDVATDGQRAVAPKDAQAVMGLLTDFLSWDVKEIIPRTRDGKIDLKAFAGMLAPLCRMLRNDVTDALRDPQSPLKELAGNWRELLFPGASDEQFADAYAQTVTFALLLARSEGADLHPPAKDPKDQTATALFNAENALSAEHSLLSKALQVLTDRDARAEISASLNLLIRVIGEVPPAALKSPKDAWLLRYKDSLPITAPQDPWLFFYEDFLFKYDEKLRKNAGAYYTPVEVVLAQVRLIDDLLTNRLGKPLGFADPGVVTLDPAVGTGTYLLGVIDHALAKVHREQGKGAVPGKATALAGNIYGFEIMAGPYAVSDLRISRTLQDWGARLPKDGIGVYLTDTLESPYVPPRDVPHILRPMADHHRKALRLKCDEPVLVCLGNPPYDRHEAADETNKSRTGGWVRWGKDEKGQESKLRDFLDPALAAGHGVHVKNLYNLYVYFWRWALWKVFEWQKDEKDEHGKDVPFVQQVERPGIASFISASSYLDGDAFCGMREHMRRLCDEIWILDLGGEGRGTRKSENVFAIQTPVAIAVTARYGKADKNTPAKVHYARIDGTRNEKLKALYAIHDFASIPWEDCPNDWQAPFRPAGIGLFFGWPLLTMLFPWQQSGCKLNRTWPIAPDGATLRKRWKNLIAASSGERAKLFRESRDRKISKRYSDLMDPTVKLVPIQSATEKMIQPVRYAYRSLDRQWIIPDNRLGDVFSVYLWAVHGDRQVYLTSLFSQPLGTGPALTACAELPDLDHFRGSYGAKAAMPLYRDATGKEANILPGLLDLLAKAYGRKVMPEDFLAYVYGVLAQPAFTERFADELGTRELRVPLTKDAGLFAQVRDVGARLLWLHTFGQRFVPKGKHKGHVPKGTARCVKPVPGDAANYPEKYEYNDATQTLHVGDGEFAPVAPEVYEFEVSGLKVVQSWLGYRMKNPKGKKSSPLDEINPKKWPSEFTTELLELLWVLEATIAEYPAQAKLLSAVVKGSCFHADELPEVHDEARRPPSRPSAKRLFDKAEDENE